MPKSNLPHHPPAPFFSKLLKNGIKMAATVNLNGLIQLFTYRPAWTKTLESNICELRGTPGSRFAAETHLGFKHIFVTNAKISHEWFLPPPKSSYNIIVASLWILSFSWFFCLAVYGLFLKGYNLNSLWT